MTAWRAAAIRRGCYDGRGIHAALNDLTLYHLAWQVDTIDELAALEQRLQAIGALVGASDHGVSRALYAMDPDGNEFEVMWATPRETWAEAGVTTRPLDLPADLRRFSGVGTLHELTAVG